MNIVLIGYRGTGKSSVGNCLSQILSLPFYDSDSIIEEQSGTSIREIVKQKGWHEFRKIESKTIALLAAKDTCIIATGGGAVEDLKNRIILKKNGFIVWLYADIPTILKRITADNKTTNQRPALLSSDINTEAMHMLKKREPIYREIADYAIDTSHESCETIATQLHTIIKTRGIICQEIH